MKKNLYALLPITLVMLLGGCSGDDSSDSFVKSDSYPADGSSVESIYDLGSCNSDRDGDIIFVEDEEHNFLCHKEKWEDIGEPESSDSDDEKSSSSKKGSSDSKDNSSSSKGDSADSKGSSSSKGDSTDSGDKSSSSAKSSSSKVPESSSSVNGAGETVKTVAISKQTFKGVAEKGPFLAGSTVRLSELDDELDLTGTNFEWEVTDDKGGFTSPKVTLSNQYAQLQVSGSYYNENIFKNSTGTITLRGIVDLKDRESANINVLMHLIYKRVVYLFTQSGKYKNVPAAKAAAEQELMKAFDFGGANHSFEDLSIFGTTEDDAKLLAASILLQGDLTEADLLSRLTSIADNIEEDGTWDNSEKTRVAMADWIMSYSYGTSGIRQMLEEIKKPVPDFEKYISLFVGEAYGFGTCTDSKDGEFMQLKDGNSANLGNYYVCEDGVWRLMLSTEKLYQASCTAKKSGEFMKPESSTSTYICDGGKGYWRPATLYDYPTEHYMNSEVEYGKFKDTRDGKEYRTVVVGTQTWMAENLNYYSKDNDNLVGNAWCYKNVDKNCNMGGRLYTWTAAMDLSSSYLTTSAAEEVKKPHQGICPDGWHVPDSTEWYKLSNYVYKVDGASGLLKSSKGWTTYSSVKVSTDPYGFSVIPTGAYYGAFADPYDDYSQTEFDDDGYFANFWTSDEAKTVTGAKYAYFDYRQTAMGFYTTQYNQKKRGFSLRCVKTEPEEEE